MLSKENRKNLVLPLVVTLQSIVLYTLFSSVLEYALTEKLLLVRHLSSWIKLLILLIFFLIIFISTFLYNEYKQIVLTKKFLIGSTIVALASLIYFNFYSSYYQKLQTYPKIFHVSQNWSTQGTKIKITGKNFGPPYKEGQVKVGSLNLLVKKWDRDKIIVEQPVTGDFFEGKLVVINSYNRHSNSINFTIKDPDKL